MTDREIKQQTQRFRIAIEHARDEGRFKEDISFDRFPWACCGDTSLLLAEYLQKYGVDSIYVENERDGGSHAWLVVKDNRIKAPQKMVNRYPEQLWDTLQSYGVANPEKPIDITHYELDDIKDALIVDITSDQFSDYDIPVYVGKLDEFHKTFSFERANDYNGLKSVRLRNLYRIIEEYLS